MIVGNCIHCGCELATNGEKSPECVPCAKKREKASDHDAGWGPRYVETMTSTVVLDPRHRRWV